MQKSARSRGSQLIYLTYLVLYIGDVRVDKSACILGSKKYNKTTCIL